MKLRLGAQLFSIYLFNCICNFLCVIMNKRVLVLI